MRSGKALPGCAVREPGPSWLGTQGGCTCPQCRECSRGVPIGWFAQRPPEIGSLGTQAGPGLCCSWSPWKEQALMPTAGEPGAG